jgi:hypothetical protein
LRGKGFIILGILCGCIALFIAVMGPGFAQGVRDSDECKAKPDHWWCQIFAKDD